MVQHDTLPTSLSKKLSSALKKNLFFRTYLYTMNSQTGFIGPRENLNHHERFSNQTSGLRASSPTALSNIGQLHSTPLWNASQQCLHHFPPRSLHNRHTVRAEEEHWQAFPTPNQSGLMRSFSSGASSSMQQERRRLTEFVVGWL